MSNCLLSIQSCNPRAPFPWDQLVTGGQHHLLAFLAGMVQSCMERGGQHPWGIPCVGSFLKFPSCWDAMMGGLAQGRDTQQKKKPSGLLQRFSELSLVWFAKIGGCCSSVIKVCCKFSWEEMDRSKWWNSSACYGSLPVQIIAACQWLQVTGSITYQW